MKEDKIAETSEKKHIESTSSQERVPALEKVSDARRVDSIHGSSFFPEHKIFEHDNYFLYGAEHLKLDNYYFDFPVVYNKKVKKWVNYFTTRGRGSFERYSARSGRYAPVLGKILEDEGLPRDLIFLAMAESGFYSKAKSWAKAVGPWQFMPYTGKRYGLKIDWYLDERRDPIKSTFAAAKYLTKLYSLFGSWELAAAAYNAGEGKIGRAKKRYRTKNFWKMSRGRYLKNETKNYVPKIMALAIIGKNLKAFGFKNIEFYDVLDFEEISLAPMSDLFKVAEILELDFETLHSLNPELLRWFTPPQIESYKLRIPVGSLSVWNDKSPKVQEYVAKDFQLYKVRGRKTQLRDIAKKFKIKNYVLEYLNGKKSWERLQRSKRIILPFRQGQSKKAPMYADLYEKPRKSVLKRKAWKRRLKIALRKGRKISSPSRYYVVSKGDSLWNIAQKTGTSLNTIIASNYKLVKRGLIRAGDRLIVQ